MSLSIGQTLGGLNESWSQCALGAAFDFGCADAAQTRSTTTMTA